MAPKGFFKKIQAKAKSGRGGGDPQAIFNDALTAYDAEGGLQEVLNTLTPEQIQELKDEMNNCTDPPNEFGDEFWTDKSSAECAWTDVTPDQQEPICAIIQQYCSFD